MKRLSITMPAVGIILIFFLSMSEVLWHMSLLSIPKIWLLIGLVFIKMGVVFFTLSRLKIVTKE